MTFYLGSARVKSGHPFAYAKRATLCIAVAFIAPPLIVGWLLRRWYVFQLRFPRRARLTVRRVIGLRDAAAAKGFGRDRIMPTAEELASYRLQPWARRPWKVRSYITYFATWITALWLYIPPIELSLHQRSPSDDSPTWSFGQVRPGRMWHGQTSIDLSDRPGPGPDRRRPFGCGPAADHWRLS